VLQQNPPVLKWGGGLLANTSCHVRW